MPLPPFRPGAPGKRPVGAGHLDHLQVLAPVEPEGGRLPVLAEEVLGDELAPRASAFQGGHDHRLQAREAVAFEQEQDPDVFARALAAVIGFQAPAQHPETLGQPPALLRTGEVQRSGLALQKRRVVDRLKADLLLLPDPPPVIRPRRLSPPFYRTAFHRRLHISAVQV